MELCDRCGWTASYRFSNGPLAVTFCLHHAMANAARLTDWTMTPLPGRRTLEAEAAAAGRTLAL